MLQPVGSQESDTTERLNNNLVPKMNIHGTDLSPVYILELRQSTSVKPKSTPDMQAKKKRAKCHQVWRWLVIQHYGGHC